MRRRAIGRSGKVFGPVLGLFLILFLFCGCSGGGVVILTGAGLQDVNVTLSGYNNMIQKTGAGGLFSFADIPNGEYVVTPEKDGFLFEPEFKAVTIENASVLTIYFLAESE